MMSVVQSGRHSSADEMNIMRLASDRARSKGLGGKSSRTINGRCTLKSRTWSG